MTFYDQGKTSQGAGMSRSNDILAIYQKYQEDVKALREKYSLFDLPLDPKKYREFVAEKRKLQAQLYRDTGGIKNG